MYFLVNKLKIKSLIVSKIYVIIIHVIDMPKWWNWQTRWTQNPMELKLRAGSIPAFGTSKFSSLVYTIELFIVSISF